MARDRWRIWHATGVPEALLGLILRHALRRRYRLVLSLSSEEWPPQGRWARWLMARMDAVIVPRRSGRAARIAGIQTRLIPPGVDTGVFAPPQDRHAAKRALGLPERDLYLGYIYPSSPDDGAERFVDAMILACKADRHLRAVLLAGTGGPGVDTQGGHAARLMARVRNAGLHHRIRIAALAGTAADVSASAEAQARWYRALDLILVTRPLGLTAERALREAMACGVPVLAMAKTVEPALLRHRETGVFVPAGAGAASGGAGGDGATADGADAAAIARAIGDLIARNALPSLGAAAAADIRAHGSLEQEAASVAALYDDLLAAKDTGGKRPC